MTVQDFVLTVPGTDLELELDGDRLVGHGRSFERGRADIWDLLPDDRRVELDRFSRDYAIVREREGRSATAAEIRRLPDTDPDHPLADMWRQRRESFERLCSFLDASPPPGTGPRRLVDIGAGSGWLAARLSACGWSAAAIDVTVEGGDGLAAARHHDEELLLVRADMGALPFADQSAELAVFNASLHYAADIPAALAEAERILRPDGLLVVLDSPVYRDPEAGRQMVAEFADHARTHLGVAAADNAGPGFVTWEQTDAFGLRPVGAPQTATERTVAQVRRLRGRLRAGREVAERPLLVATSRSRAQQTPAEARRTS